MKYGVGDFRLTENLWMVIAKPVGRFSVVIIGVLSVIKHLKWILIQMDSKRKSN
tara:strand:+ start:226 stop:387 length:162 start_codon:yes stop_codon:yes gene_type:complete